MGKFHLLLHISVLAASVCFCSKTNEDYPTRTDLNKRARVPLALAMRDLTEASSGPTCWSDKLEEMTSTSTSGSLVAGATRCLRFTAGEADKAKTHQYALKIHSGDIDLYISHPDCSVKVKPSETRDRHFCIWRNRSTNVEQADDVLAAEPGVFIVIGVEAFRAGNYTLDITQL